MPHVTDPRTIPTLVRLDDSTESFTVIKVCFRSQLVVKRRHKSGVKVNESIFGRAGCSEYVEVLKLVEAAAKI
jgi:hypothetical protein